MSKAGETCPASSICTPVEELPAVLKEPLPVSSVEP